MKINFLVWLCAIFISLGVSAQEKKTVTFQVYGNCGMCKETIEGSLKKKDGIVSKKWDVKAKQLTVTYDPSKINIKQIGQKVADAGYDNAYASAPDEKYNKLHSCCKYKRPETK